MPSSKCLSGIVLAGVLALVLHSTMGGQQPPPPATALPAALQNYTAVTAERLKKPRARSLWRRSQKRYLTPYASPLAVGRG